MKKNVPTARKRLSAKWIGRSLFAAAIVAASTAAALGLWQKVRPHVSAQPEYLVDVGEIKLTPQPKWIRAKVKAEVLRDAGLPAQLSILDERLNELLLQAFSLHPWIAAVENVETSYPAQISITVTYRRPVAMVEVNDGLLPVDAGGVLLPPDDFTPQDAIHYPRIAGLAGSPLGPIGTRWGNPLVEAGARLAAVLEPTWHELQLHCIALHSGAGSDAAATTLQIETQNGTVFVWGKPPGSERAGEPKADEKVSSLQRRAKLFGSLDKTPPDQRDVSQSDSLN
ncbi:MAG: hypothetical protein IT427_02060 [Pirellulales bacterium]|nr:hypothetical protein [Pirellulales bacterium]